MKTYVKPDLRFEGFALSEHIATCFWDMSNLKTKEECSAVQDAEMGDGTTVIFTREDICTDGDLTGAYCWTVSTDGFNVFNS